MVSSSTILSIACFPQISFVDYKNESQIDDVMRLVALDLSEPYSIFTYRYFLHRFPDLCILAVEQETGDVCGCVVGKIDLEDDNSSHPEPPTSPPSPPSSTNLHIPATPAPTSPPQQLTGYIGMLAVSKSYRRRGIGKALVRQVLRRMKDRGCASVTLETEVSNVTAQKLYQEFGFVREELLVRYYLNNSDAYRLRLWFC
jgi:N-alpha-acetyltransferase 30